MTTATKLTPAEVKTRLEELLSATAEYAAAEAKMQRLAAQLATREDDWIFGVERFGAAVDGQIRAALHDVQHPEEMRDALALCQVVQDAVDVLKFAIERGDDAR
jgi:hypothetical protein